MFAAVVSMAVGSHSHLRLAADRYGSSGGRLGRVLRVQAELYDGPMRVSLGDRKRRGWRPCSVNTSYIACPSDSGGTARQCSTSYTRYKTRGETNSY
jgi:hypothetical protein